jgi:hypothetical protein
MKRPRASRSHRTTPAGRPRAGWGRPIGLGLAAAAALSGSTLLLASPTTGSAAVAAAAKVTLCHRTDAENNPYGPKPITVSASAAYHGHYLEHQGDVWYPGHPKKPMWGDIIPPFTFQGVTYSLNWNAAGMAIFNNGCQPLTASTSSVATSSSAGISGSSSASAVTSVVTTTVGGVAVIGGTTAAAPIPGAVVAGRHTAITNSEERDLGIALVAAAAMGAGLTFVRPIRRRAH